MLRLVSTEASMESVLPRNAAIRLTHGGLLLKNIIVNGSTITGIIDWEMDGFYPAYWEYCHMHDLVWRTPGWDCVLALQLPNWS
ncbi:hypothetical protein A0H81_08976 [Grifola frondosa]|uniref:Aminoglycoside phosphotransferase domain-containing protein n=1 Tax=Grifola frondosa TaxID=5627 RepID=A0A1C7M365_GRIFR|nr:hypothetical protein A0H81_08976 [Grifola frondosa]